MTKDTTLSLKNDYVFKAVYGNDSEDSKFILKSLLNKILDREDNPIVDIEYKNPFQSKFSLDEKETIMDIKAETSLGEMIDIEMQIVWDKYMPHRLIYYHSGLVRDSLKEGELYRNIKPTITICITNSIAFKDSPLYLNEFYFMEDDEHFKLSDITRICCIELPKVNPDNRPLDELTPLEICLEYLRCATGEPDEYAQSLIAKGGKELEMVQHKLTKVTEDELLRERAIAREKYQRDMLSFEDSKQEHMKSVKEHEKNVKELRRLKKEHEKNVKELREMRENFQLQQEALAQKQKMLADQKDALAQEQKALADQKDALALERNEFEVERAALEAERKKFESELEQIRK